ncbi:MAG: acetate/propionate family kinase [Rhodospirillales bacterium]|jgi:acetate kinase|nr:acetate/propionate family kinase [Rhodospirillales bacterium]
MSENILVLNAGSSSIKFALFNGTDSETVRGQIGGIGSGAFFEASGITGKPDISNVSDHTSALKNLFGWIAGKDIKAVGHRVVHGGGDFVDPVCVTGEIITALAALEPLAPHHQPHNVAAMRAVAGLWPDVVQIACFDTAFHASMPPEAQETGLPRDYTEAGIRRYGFHGLSYTYVVQALPAMTEDGKLPPRVIALHLGNGGSLCAIKNGRSIATSMGYSTADGIPMATRSGAVDPGALIAVMRRDGLDADGLEDLLYNQSGVLGMSGGLSADMKTLVESPDPQAKQAVDFYCYRLAREVGSLASALGGLDAMVFTGGIGANSSVIRENVCKRLAWLGVGEGNTYAYDTDEEAVIAGFVRDFLAQ